MLKVPLVLVPVVQAPIWFYPLEFWFFVPEFHTKMIVHNVTIADHYALSVKTIRQVSVYTFYD